jgi:hypothetical protein
VEFENKAQWIAAVGDYITIDFTGFPVFTFITDQYKQLGVSFVDPANLINGPNPDSYPNDGWGLDGNSYIELSFSSPQHWLAADFPDATLIQLYLDGEFVNAGAAWFGFDGVVSDIPFNAAILLDFSPGQVHIDDLHFGAQAPGDSNNDGAVDLADLLEVILAWGACPPEELCFPDHDDNGVVDVEDLAVVLINWE